MLIRYPAEDANLKRDSDPFLVSMMSNRSAGSWAGVAVGVAGTLGVLWFVPRMEGGWKVLPVVLSVMLGAATALGLRKIASGGYEQTRIDRQGVLQGLDFWEWSRVKWLYAEGWPGCQFVDLKIQVRGGVFEIDLPVWPRLTSEAYEELIRSLRRTVGIDFPDVEFGGYQMPP